VIEPRPLTFTEDWAEALFEGVPVIECVLQAFVGRCQTCGRSETRQRDGSVLVDVLVLDGTLYGDTYCTGCFDEIDHDPDDMVFFLPPPE